MCRLIGWAADPPTTLEGLVGAAALDDFVAVSRLHPDGWGMAFAGAGEVEEEGLEGAGDGQLQLHRSTASAESEPRFRTLTQNAAARGGLVHLRRATAGFAVCNNNTHPFSLDGWAFAHNGGIPHPERIDELLGARWRALRQGDTDSEGYFLALLERTELHGDLVDGIRATVAELREACGDASMNAMLLNRDVLAVVSASAGAKPPTDELLASVGTTPRALPRGHSERYYDLRYRVVPGGVVVSSTGMPDDSWTAMPPETILVADLARAGSFALFPLLSTASLAHVS